MTNTVRPAILVALPWLLLLGVVACTVGPGGGPPTDGGPSGSPVADSPVADSPVADSPVGGGSSAGSPGGGPSASDGSGGTLPDPGTPTLVVPKPGRLGPHPVGATSIAAQVVGGRVVARLTWWSGVAPCTVLDSVTVEQAGRRITLTIVEGADRLDVACIEIAMLKATDVDLGVLAPGSWLISAYGDAPPTTIVVP
jgi:hypothetical protein